MHQAHPPSGTGLSDFETSVDDDTLNEVIMAVNMTTQGVLGTCYYVAKDETLYLMEDTACGSVELVESSKSRLDHAFEIANASSETVHRPNNCTRFHED
jgi:hypothetical protein